MTGNSSGLRHCISQWRMVYDGCPPSCSEPYTGSTRTWIVPRSDEPVFDILCGSYTPVCTNRWGILKCIRFICIDVWLHLCIVCISGLTIVCMYVYMYVCVCVCVIYVCMYVCMDGRMYVCMCVCIGVHVCVCVYVCVCMYDCIYVYMCMYVCVCLLMNVCISINECMYICMYVCYVCMDVCTDVCMYVCVCTGVHVCVCVCMCVYVCTNVYMYKCIYVCVCMSISMNVCIYVCMYACMHISVCVYVCPSRDRPRPAPRRDRHIVTSIPPGTAPTGLGLWSDYQHRHCAPNVSFAGLQLSSVRF